MDISCIQLPQSVSIVLPRCDNNRCVEGGGEKVQVAENRERAARNTNVSTFAPRPFLNARCAVPDARVSGRCFPPVS